jgi:hypothetical protein
MVWTGRRGSINAWFDDDGKLTEKVFTERNGTTD